MYSIFVPQNVRRGPESSPGSDEIIGYFQKGERRAPGRRNKAGTQNTMERSLNLGETGAPETTPVKCENHNRLFRPALPPLRRAVIQTGVSLCSVRIDSPPLFSRPRPARGARPPPAT